MKLVDNKVTKFVTKRKSWIRQILVAAIAAAFAWFLGFRNRFGTDAAARPFLVGPDLLL